MPRIGTEVHQQKGHHIWCPFEVLIYSRCCISNSGSLWEEVRKRGLGLIVAINDVHVEATDNKRVQGVYVTKIDIVYQLQRIWPRSTTYSDH